MSRRIAITLGDPGGIGPDICVMMAKSNITRNHIFITDPKLLLDSSKKLKIKIQINLLKKTNCKKITTNQIKIEFIKTIQNNYLK